MQTLLKWIAAAAAIYLVIVAVAFAVQRNLMYFPDTRRVAPEALGLVGIAERVMTTQDGAQLITWRALAQPGQPTLLYFHGNGGGLANRAMRLARYQSAGFGFLIMSWRGYSGGTGSPTEANNVADGERAYHQLIAEGVAPQDIVLYGESLGTGVAVQLAARLEVGALILDAPYTSAVDVARLAYPLLPAGPLLLDRYESDRFIGRIKAPLLVLHGARDDIIPVEMGRRLFAAAPEPKELVVFPRGGHVDLDSHGAVETVVDWLRRVRVKPRSSSSPAPPG